MRCTRETEEFIIRFNGQAEYCRDCDEIIEEESREEAARLAVRARNNACDSCRDDASLDNGRDCDACPNN